ncbi:serine/arginine-rich splicing factor 4-like [Argiope bruennichi]|uniref:serine/arginine-rich splicing factor 4-like n=1 Tax=Argiope bruennichi TaxID=94029 RepID=UPI0024954C16|nr:serine/arginine-rich splicing factor 4-like [Argiope bruennichi]XP_055949122.1 serine/arginine-rich splicing factor 4-like [Argiope bruennichi]XP_055949123.1 serine/arginine-rich splicing factor 4-like [Argiope bruennichi]XP_055949124.1 serine/arginine-rich splicing factor 4-like [Argiope bruennichi]
MGTRVYVGRLSWDCRERDLERFFKGYGRIREILIKNGFGFVEFDDYKDADDAVYELNGKELLGERVILEIARGPVRRTGGRLGFRRRGSWLDKYGPPTRTEYRLIVENLSSKVSWQDLKDYMRQAGEITYADAHKQRRNEGVVEFATYSDMKNAYNKLNDTELNGRRIRLIEDRSHRSRRFHSRSSSRSHSKSRSRSRSPHRSHSRSTSRSRSRSRSISHSKSPAKSVSRSPLRGEAMNSRSKSRSVSRSRARSASRSRSPSKSRSPKAKYENED